MGQQQETVYSIVLHRCQRIGRLQTGGAFTEHRRQSLERLIMAAGFATFGSMTQHFSEVPTHGYTFVCVLGQSAVNIHTYPENETVSVLLVTCPGEDDNGSATVKYESLLKEYFGAKTVRSKTLGHIPLQVAA